MSERGGLWHVIALPLVLAVVYVASAMGGHGPLGASLAEGPDPDALVAQGALLDRLLAEGEVERLALSLFLHATPLHLAANCLWWVCLALALRRLRRDHNEAAIALGVWFCGGVAGQLTSWLSGSEASVGASGAVFATAGFLAVTVWRALPPGRPGRLQRWSVLVLVAAVFLLSWLLPVDSAVDHAAHVGGLLAGAGLGLSGPRQLKVLALTAAVAMLASAGFKAARSGTVPAPMSAEVRDARGTTGLLLPVAGRAGWLLDGRCDPDASESPAAVDCQLLSWSMVAAAGDLASIRQSQPSLAPHVPEPGDCVRYSDGDENVLLIRPHRRTLLVFATKRREWPRTRELRARLRDGRCSGSGILPP